MFRQTKVRSIKQHALKPAISRYLAFHERSPEVLAHFAEGKGCCSGLTTVVLFGLFMSKQPKSKNQTYDDWRRIKKTFHAILAWEAPLSANDKSKYIEPDFERLIGNIIYYQSISDFLPVRQGEIQRSFFSTHPNPLRKEYTLAGIFTAEHLTRTIKIGTVETSILQIILKEQDRMILISTGRHALGLLRHAEQVTLYNANAKKLKKYDLDQLNVLAKQIFRSAMYSDELLPCQFGFRIFSFAKKLAVYPSQEKILAALNPPITTTELVNHKKPMALMIAIRIESVASAKYYLAHGAPVNELNHNKHTPLRSAIKHNNQALIKLLLEYQAAIDQVDDEQTSPLQFAATRANIAAIKMLLEHEPHCQTRHLITALRYLPTQQDCEQLLERMRKNKLKSLLKNIPHEASLLTHTQNHPLYLKKVLRQTYLSLFGPTNTIVPETLTDTNLNSEQALLPT